MPEEIRGAVMGTVESINDYLDTERVFFEEMSHENMQIGTNYILDLLSDLQGKVPEEHTDQLMIFFEAIGKWNGKVTAAVQQRAGAEFNWAAPCNIEGFFGDLKRALPQ